MAILVLILIVSFVFQSVANGWAFRKAASWLGHELDFMIACFWSAGVLAATFIAYFALFFVLLGSSPVVWDMIRHGTEPPEGTSFAFEGWVIQIGGAMISLALWTAAASIALDIDLPKAGLVAILVTILQFVMSCFLIVLMVNLVLVGGMMLMGVGT